MSAVLREHSMSGWVSRETGGSAFTEAATAVLEARAESRVAAGYRVDVLSSDFSRPLGAHVRDIGVGGACIATEGRIAPDSVRRVTLHLPKGMLTLEARGRWQSVGTPDEAVLTGIAFENTGAADSAILADCVQDEARALCRFVLGCPDLAELAFDDAMGLAQASRYRIVPTGRCIYKQDEGSPSLGSIFLVAEGRVSLWRRVQDARNVTFATLGEGGLFGGAPILAEAPNLEYAVAGARTRLFEISPASFNYLTLAKPLLAHRVTRCVAHAQMERMRAVLERAAASL